MTQRTPNLDAPESRGYLHKDLQRKVLYAAIAVSVVLAALLIPVMVNAELRLDIFRRAGFVVGNEGELIADGDSGASLIVLPTEHSLESTDRTQLRFLAAFIAWPESGALRLESLGSDGELVIPLDSYAHVASSPDGTEMYIRGTDRAALIDVRDAEVIEELPADVDPDVSWDWQTAVWQRETFICDRVSNTAAWIGCFPRPVLASYLAGDWQLELRQYGNTGESHEVMRGLGFQPIIGFTADDSWLYVYNERGIRRFNVAKVTGS